MQLNTRKGLINERECADYRGCSLSKVQKERMRGDGPPFVKMNHLVRYRLQDVDEWIAARVVSSTSEKIAA